MVLETRETHATFPYRIDSYAVQWCVCTREMAEDLIGVYKEKVTLMFTVNSLYFKKNNTRKALNTTKRVQEGSKEFFINNRNLLRLHYLNIHNHPRFHLSYTAFIVNHLERALLLEQNAKIQCYLQFKTSTTFIYLSILILYMGLSLCDGVKYLLSKLWYLWRWEYCSRVIIFNQWIDFWLVVSDPWWKIKHASCFSYIYDYVSIM